MTWQTIKTDLANWFKQSKPTEWITAIVTLLGIIAVYMSGIIDQKRSELEQKKSELTVQNILLEEKEATQNAKVAQLQKHLEVKNEELASLTSYQSAVSTLARMHESYEYGDKKGPSIRCSLQFGDDQITISGVRAESHNIGFTGRIPQVLICPQKRLFLSCLSKLSKLVSVRIEDIALDRVDIVQIADMQLSDLSLVNCGLTDDTFEGVLFHSLSGLVLRENHLTKLPRIEDASMISVLDIGRTDIGDDQLSSFVASISRGYAFHLDNTPITDQLIDSLNVSDQAFFTKVDINATKVSLDGLRTLLGKKNIKVVGVQHGQFDKKGIRKILKEVNPKASVEVSSGSTFDRLKDKTQQSEAIRADDD